MQTTVNELCYPSLHLFTYAHKYPFVYCTLPRIHLFPISLYIVSQTFFFFLMENSDCSQQERLAASILHYQASRVSSVRRKT